MENKIATQTQEEKLVIRVVLKEYLMQLHGIEVAKLPSQRRAVPTLTELAKITGIHRVTLTNFANNKMKLINLATLAALLNELRRRGFECELTDLLKTYPIGEVS